MYYYVSIASASRQQVNWVVQVKPDQWDPLVSVIVSLLTN